MKITPNALWLMHRAAAGGVSTVTGAPLPATLDDCPPGPQATHYAMACFVATLTGDPEAVSIPSKVTPEDAERLRALASERAREYRLVAVKPGLEEPPFDLPPSASE